jgi:hypothetical protein
MIGRLAHAKIVLSATLTTISVFMVVPLGLPNQSHPPTEINVQIMDSHDHRPLKHRKVQITFSGMDGQWYSQAHNMTGYTGSDGIAVFQVTEPVPPLVAVFVWWAYPCSRPENFSTESVIKDGVVAQWHLTGITKTDKSCAANPQAPQLVRQAGKVIFFVHPMNRFAWAWYDTWE